MDIIGSQVMHLHTVHSTNSWLLEQCQRKEMPEGTLVVADHQTAGRGQRGNSWQAPAGQNLTCSVLLRPHRLPPYRAFMLNKLAALAVRHALTQHAPKARIQVKWPNDVYIDGKKAAGILIENIIQGQRIAHSVVGIGINALWHPAELATTTCLQAHTDATVLLSAVLDNLLHSLNDFYRMLQMELYTRLDALYLEHLYLLHEPHVFTHQDQPLAGTITGVNAHGQLLIHTAAGTQAFDLKQVQF